MAMGVYCDSCKHKELEHKFDKWPCMDCCDGDRRDPVRNADRIRAMTDEELAEWFSIYCCRNKTYDAHCETFGSCKACWFSWLQEEAR